VFQKSIAVALTAIVSCMSCIARAQGQPDKAASVKAEVQKIGTGGNSVVRVRLKDGTEHMGYLSQIDSFTVTDKATKKANSISYGDVQSVKLKGKGLSTRTKVLIVVGVGVAIAAGVIAYAATHLKI